MNRMYLMAFIAIALMGCGTSTFTSTVRTAAGDRVEQTSEGPFNKDTSITVDATAAYRDCLSQNAPTLGAAQADAYCRNATSGGPGGVASPTGSIIAVPQGYPGMNSPNYPGAYNGLPGAAPILITPTAVIDRQRNTGNGAWVPNGSGSTTMSGPSDVELLMESQLNQEQRLCEVEKRQGLPCKK